MGRTTGLDTKLNRQLNQHFPPTLLTGEGKNAKLGAPWVGGPTFEPQNQYGKECGQKNGGVRPRGKVRKKIGRVSTIKTGNRKSEGKRRYTDLTPQCYLNLPLRENKRKKERPVNMAYHKW